MAVTKAFAVYTYIHVEDVCSFEGIFCPTTTKTTDIPSDHDYLENVRSVYYHNPTNECWMVIIYVDAD